MCADSAVDALSHNHKNEAYELMAWVEQAYPDLTDTPLFLNNLAFRAHFAGRMPDAITHRRRLVERFPDHEGTPWQLHILGNDYFEVGAHERAADTHRRALEHPKADADLRRHAAEGIEMAERRPKVIVIKKPGVTTFITLPEDGRNPRP